MTPSARLNTAALVAKHRANVVDVPSYTAACADIDNLVTMGQVTPADATAARAELATVMAGAIAQAAAQAADNSKADDKPKMKVTPGGMVGFGRSAPGANQQYGLSLFPKTLQWLFTHRDLVDKWIADHSAELSWTKADTARFAERKAKAEAEYRAKAAK
jgi:hypothetical protein